MARGQHRQDPPSGRHAARRLLIWPHRGKRAARLPRQLALGLLTDAMGRVQGAEDRGEEKGA